MAYLKRLFKVKSSRMAASLKVLLVALLLTINAKPALAVTLADFVFIVDATGSMAGEIAAVKAGLSGFVSGLSAASVDARFAIILYGGAPELVLDFTSSGTDTVTAFNTISVSGAVTNFQNNHNVNPEAGLEAIQIALNSATNNTLLRTNIGGGAGPLSFRAGARKNLILVTDEDSDRPFYAGNQFAGQSSNEPPAFPNANWQADVDAAASAVIANDAFINLIINAADVPSRSQYGDPAQDVSDADFLNYDPATTLANLTGAGFGSSLQGQVLSAGLIARSFNISQINNADFIDNFFAAKIEETVDNPLPPSGVIPEPSTMMLLGLGLAGGALRSSKKGRKS